MLNLTSCICGSYQGRVKPAHYFYKGDMMSFLAYMTKVATLNYNCNYQYYQQFDDSFMLYNDQINDATCSRELATIEAELTEWCM